MRRQSIGNGKWFDLDTATSFTEETQFDGRNHISLATCSQWEHQELYRTKSGTWVLNEWSQWQGSTDTWTEIDDEDAARWLVRNEYDPHEACKSEYEALEI